MALALSLSLDLFLMKGSLFIAVKAQARDRRTDRWTEEKEKAVEGKQQKRRKDQRDVVNIFTKGTRGEMQRES